MKKILFSVLIFFLLISFNFSKVSAASDRIAGSHRYATAVEISKNGWSKADTVVLAIGENFPDALAGGPLAYKLDAPILLSRKDELGAVTRAEITRLGAKKAVILGSTAVITTKVDNELKGLGITVERIGGRDRFETAAQIAKKLGTTDTAIVAYGHNFPDALAIAPYAARNGIPILLSRTDDIPSSTKDSLKGKKRTYVIGGSSILSNKILSQMPNAKRISGSGRFSTAAAVIREFQMDANNAYAATGMNFADALTGSVLAAKKNGVILLVEPTNLPTPIKELLNVKKFSEVLAIGGTTTVSDNVLNEIKGLVKNEKLENALPINVNQLYTGSFESRSVSKFYKFNLSNSGNVKLSLSNIAGSNWNLSLVDRNGTSYVDFSSNSSSYATGNTEVPIGLPAGEYFIKLDANSNSTNVPFTFSVKYEKSEYYEKERNNTLATATPINVNKVNYGSIQNRYNDLDYYKFSLPKAGNISLKMKNQPDAYWNISVLSETGDSLVTTSTDSSSNATGWQTVDVGLPAGTYYIKINTSNNNTVHQQYSFEASFIESEFYEKEFNNSTGTATTIAVNKKYQGSIQNRYDDLDYYKFKLEKAGNIQIKALNKPNTLWRYILYNANGQEIKNFSTNTSSVSNSETNIPVGLPSGEYYLRVSGLNNETNHTPYTFTVDFVMGEYFERELNNTALTATPIVLNQNYTGAIQNSYNDHDYYKFSLNNASQVTVTVKNQYNVSWRYTIYNSSGNSVLNFSTDTGQFAAETKEQTIDLIAGDYYIRVEGYNTHSEDTPYFFKVNR
ncbi:cell wall-binding repeat-containing protein [Sutcliffiella halmapala]|uniref:cell wall-binding repeat-containing protein n=1 Tax=Sutcliffiella halmapala TaxID=79882 RepID=UPI000995B1D7|nr:cell wall-binding repeat-containing protein [Sutcliffiella halmapala]